MTVFYTKHNTGLKWANAVLETSYQKMFLLSSMNKFIMHLKLIKYLVKTKL